MSHRRFLPHDHEFRFEVHAFDGTQELRETPIPLSGYDVSNQTKDLHTIFGKTVTKEPTKKTYDHEMMVKRLTIIQSGHRMVYNRLS